MSAKLVILTHTDCYNQFLGLKRNQRRRTRGSEALPIDGELAIERTG